MVCRSLFNGKFMLHITITKYHPEKVVTGGVLGHYDLIWRKVCSLGKYGLYYKPTKFFTE